MDGHLVRLPAKSRIL